MSNLKQRILDAIEQGHFRKCKNCYNAGWNDEGWYCAIDKFKANGKVENTLPLDEFNEHICHHREPDLKRRITE